MGADGKPAPPGLIPTLEESIDNKVWIVGTAEQVAEQIAWYRDEIGLTELTIFPHMPGDTYDTAIEQIHRFGQDVAPLLR